jgi:glycosyltransferase involved in cell wall biosynthesis
MHTERPRPAALGSSPKGLASFVLPHGRYVVCAKADDPIARPARARLIWAANTAQATHDLGVETLLAGGGAELPFKAEALAGRYAVQRLLSHFYGVEGNFEVQLLYGHGKKDERPVNILKEQYPRNVFPRAGLVHTRDPAIAAACARRKINYILEDHSEDYQVKFAEPEALALDSKNCRAVVAITEAVRERLLATGCPDEKIIVLDSGVNAGAANRRLEAATRWRRFLLDGGYSRLVCYSGGMQRERGIEHLLDAAHALPYCRFVFLGGHDKDIAPWRELVEQEGLSNVKILGYQPHEYVCDVQQASDILVMSRSERGAITSPLKFFEYLLAGAPIVAATIPTLARFENSELDVTWYDPTESGALWTAIEQRFSQGLHWPCYRPLNIAEGISYSWRDRQRRLLDFVGPIEPRVTF